MIGQKADAATNTHAFRIDRTQDRMQNFPLPQSSGVSSAVGAPLALLTVGAARGMADTCAGKRGAPLPNEASAALGCGAAGPGMPACKRPCPKGASFNPKIMQRKSCVNNSATEPRECGYMGVRWSRKKNKWRVRIKANGKVSHSRLAGRAAVLERSPYGLPSCAQILPSTHPAADRFCATQDNHVGFYSEPVTAAIAYDEALKKYNPNWAADPTLKLNFPGSGAHGLPTGAGAVAETMGGLSRLAPLTNLDQRGGALVPGPADILSQMQAHVSSSGRLCSDASFASLVPRPSARLDSTCSSFSPLGGVMLRAATSNSASPCQLAPLHPAHWKFDTHGKAVGGAEQKRASRKGEDGRRAHQGTDTAERKKHKKASLSHLLDDKTSLARTPSPADPTSAAAGNRGCVAHPPSRPCDVVLCLWQLRFHARFLRG